MDPVTHALVGVGLSKLAGQPLSLDNPAFVGAVLGSMVPDLDIVLQKWGDYIYLKNHRCVSHSLIGIGVLSYLITLFLMFFYQQMSFSNVLLWTFIGCLLHSGMDLLNPYGVKLFWPFYNEKISFGLIIVFDPIVFIILVVDALSGKVLSDIACIGLVGYILIRVLMIYYTQYRIGQHFCVDRKNVSVFPSMLGLFKLHFIIRMEEELIIGEKSVFTDKVKIIDELEQMEPKLLDQIAHTPIAKFFAEFTPFYHITWDEDERMFRFTDVRYYVRHTFLHHATARINDEHQVIEQRFHPYSMKRSVEIPG